jgi:site-specific DNA-cytosine methylase
MDGAPPHLFDTDPTTVPWVHVLVARMSYRSFSPTSSSQPIAVDGGAATLRSLLWAAAMRPWTVVLEGPLGLKNLQDGVVWQLVKGTLKALGYILTTVRV